MTLYVVTATFNVHAASIEDAVERVTEMLDAGRAVSPETMWSVFEPDGTEYEIEWNEDELPDPDEDNPSGYVYDPADDDVQPGDVVIGDEVFEHETEAATT